MVERAKAVEGFWQSRGTSVADMYLNEHGLQIDADERREILGYLPDFSGQEVLELAAGIGRFTGHLAERARHVTSLELVQKFVDASRITNAAFDNITYVCADAANYDVAAEHYDLIFINWLFMYLDDIEVIRLVNKLHAGLKPGGCMYVRESCDPEGWSRNDDYYVHYRRPAQYDFLFAQKFGLLNRGVPQTYSAISANNRFWLLQKK